MWLKDFRLEVTGYRPLKEAIITAGGVNTREVDPRTMASRLVRGLYFTGEVLDVDADTGGYNLQAAFSTGWVAGRSAALRSTGRALRALALSLITLIFLNCAHNPPRVQHVPGTSPSPAVPWTPPAVVSHKASEPQLVVPIEQVRAKFSKLTLADVVDISLKNNPATKAAWADARAAAANYGSSRGAWYPTVNLDGAVIRSKGTSSQSRSDSSGSRTDAPITNYSAEANLSYLLFDFGGRSALVEESRQALLAADWTQNAVIQNTVLEAEVAFFNYAGTMAMLEANRVSLSEAEANLNAAEERHRVGLATNADVLQAKTAYSEVKLAVQGVEGQVRTAKGALAVSMGYPANVSYDFVIVSPEIRSAGLSQTVDQLIDQALASRPDLQASRALALQSAANVRQAWSRSLPSISATGSAARTWIEDVPGFRNTYSGALLLQIPIFTGFSHRFDIFKAKAEAEAAKERARGVEQTVVFQVFSAHSDFLTADERIKTTDDLVASGLQSEEVALGRYKEGVGSILELLSAQRALAMARAEQINARLGWFMALAQLAHDVGILGPHGENPLDPGVFLPR
jgi:outer membrane protein TolC